MTASSLLRRMLFFGLPTAIAVAAVIYWINATGQRTLAARLAGANPGVVAAMLILTAVWLGARFLRWQFLLRRVGVRVPIRPSLAVYLAGIPGTATPAYVGELVRGFFLRRRFGVPFLTATWVLILERCYDVLALAIISIAAGGIGGGIRLAGPLALLALAIVVPLVVWPMARRIGLEPALLRWSRTPATVAAALACSLASWSAAALLVGLGGRAIGIPIDAGTGADVFSTSTLIGAATLLPAGAGATGSAAILQLTTIGLAVADAVAVISLVRLTSTYAALLVGAGFLWAEFRWRPSSQPHDRAHFDEIAHEYSAQWSSHVWDHLLARKTALIAGAVPPGPAAGAGPLGLDLGCGLGVQTKALRDRGLRVVGLEPSLGLLRAGRASGKPFVAGDARALPFPDASFDFVYAIGVLHHLPGRVAQAEAYREVARVLKPGGVFLVHETNTRNPLFRFYMGYLFPIVKSIDEGTEWWIEPDQPAAPATLVRESVHFFTFLPDFTPKFLMRPARALERALEHRQTRTYAAHYMAVLRRAHGRASS